MIVFYFILDIKLSDWMFVLYLQFYGYLSQQQNMMQDYIRTSTYQRAMLANIDDFHDKVGAIFMFLMFSLSGT